MYLRLSQAELTLHEHPRLHAASSTSAFSNNAISTQCAASHFQCSSCSKLNARPGERRIGRCTHARANKTTSSLQNNPCQLPVPNLQEVPTPTVQGSLIGPFYSPRSVDCVEHCCSNSLWNSAFLFAGEGSTCVPLSLQLQTSHIVSAIDTHFRVISIPGIWFIDCASRCKQHHTHVPPEKTEF